jgi:hypothetical protein
MPEDTEAGKPANSEATPVAAAGVEFVSPSNGAALIEETEQRVVVPPPPLKNVVIDFEDPKVILSYEVETGDTLADPVPSSEEVPPQPKPRWFSLPYVRDVPVDPNIGETALRINLNITVRGRDFSVMDCNYPIYMPCALEAEQKHLLWEGIPDNLRSVANQVATHVRRFLIDVNGPQETSPESQKQLRIEPPLNPPTLDRLPLPFSAEGLPILPTTPNK